LGKRRRRRRGDARQVQGGQGCSKPAVESLRGGMEQYQRGKAQENEAAINQLMSKQTAPARAAELANIDASREASMRGAVDQARAASPVTQVAGTNTSPTSSRPRKPHRRAWPTRRQGDPAARHDGRAWRAGRRLRDPLRAHRGQRRRQQHRHRQRRRRLHARHQQREAESAALAGGRCRHGLWHGGMFALPAAGSAAMVPAADAAAYEGGAHLGGTRFDYEERPARCGALGPLLGSSAAARAAMRGALAAYGRGR
jgi:hypothetical protein